MAYKKLSEATLVESVAEETNVLVEENDEIKRVPVSKMGMSAGGGGKEFIIYKTENDSINSSNFTAEELKAEVLKGNCPVVFLVYKYADGYNTAIIPEIYIETDNVNCITDDGSYYAVDNNGEVTKGTMD